MNKCLACGIEKDMAVLEIYPFEEDCVCTDEPILPLFNIDCQGGNFGPNTDWRIVTVCHLCFHKLDPDMWISDKCWAKLNPVTPFSQLPKLEV